MTKESQKSSSFLTEALIISVSNFVVKIIGVLYKIPLASLLQDSMGVFTAAYSIYAMLFMVSTSGLPVAISRLVAASAEKGRKRETDAVFRTSVIALGIIGFICALALFLLSEPIAVWSKHPDAGIAMKVIAPTLFFICITSACRGYFQGLRNMYPTAISQFIEAFFKLTIGLGAAVWAKNAGFSPAIQAAAAISGLTVGVFFGTVFLVLYKRFSKKRRIREVTDERETELAIAKKLSMIALPVTITASALYMTQFLDTLVINRCLTSAGYELAVAERLYAAYTTLAISISDLLPSTFVYPIAMSILPAVAAALAVGKVNLANKYIHQSVRISGIIAIPCAFCLCALSRECIALIYGASWGTDSGNITLLSGASAAPIDIAAACLSMLSIGIVFISLLSTTNALLQACGKVYYPMISVCAGVAALVVTEIALVSSPAIGLYGAPIATLVCYALALTMNMLMLHKQAPGIDLGAVRLFGKPCICAAASAVACLAIRFVCSAISGGGEGRLISGLCIALSVVVAVPVYAALLLALKGVTADEVRLLPKGRALCRLLVRKGLITDTSEEENEG